MKSPLISVITCLLLVSAGLQVIEGAKILALLNLPSPSHYIFNRVLLVALANKGHQVTVLSASKEKTPVPNLKNIVLENIYNVSRDTYDYEAFVEMDLLRIIYAMFDWGVTMCEAQLETAGAQELLKYPSTKQFDLIIVEAGWGECFFGFIHKFGYPPVIATSGIGVPPWLSMTMSNPENPSYIPNFLLPYADHMSFTEKLYNFVIHHIVTLAYKFIYIPKQENIAKKFFKEDMPNFNDLTQKMELVLVNTVFGLDNSRPLLPNVIPIGGMHIKEKPEPLPKDLQKFLDEAKDGFIYFSLGTNIRSEFISLERRNALLQAFSEIPQRILWKYESEDITGVPPNVKISPWVPQSDVLAHPNIRAFISHCGMMSSMEASYRGVPIIGMPFFLDQRVNNKKLIMKGVAVQLDYLSITKENVLKAVKTITENNSYRENAKKLSALFKDQPQSPLDLSVFWTEYVLRHNGAPHLRSAANDLSWYQYLLLDVVLFLATGVLLIITLIYFILRTIFRLFTRKTIKKTKTS